MITKICSKCKIEKEIYCFGMDKSTSSGFYPQCKDCKKDNINKWRNNNKEKVNGYKKKYFIKNKEKINEKSKLKYLENSSKITKNKRDWYKLNKEKHDNYKKKWQVKNKHKSRSYTSTRRAIMKNAMPKWISEIQKMQIEWFYKAAEMMTDTTGIKYQVDHIHPLKGNGFNGLHVPWNLQIISESENKSKSNKLIEG